MNDPVPVLGGVHLERVELRRIRDAAGTPVPHLVRHRDVRDVLLVKAVTTDGEGWAECATEPAPLYSAEYIDAAEHVLAHHLLPRLFAAGRTSRRRAVGTLLAPVKGHRMAKAALETAVLDAELRAPGCRSAPTSARSATRSPCGVSVGITDTIDELLDARRRLPRRRLPPDQAQDRAGLGRRAGRAPSASAFGDDLPLQVDANTAYTLADARHLAAARPVRPAAHRAAAGRGRPASATPSWPR